MIQSGYVTDVFYENGNGLGRFTADRPWKRQKKNWRIL